VTLQARRVDLTDGATIAAASTGAGNAGNITITSQDSFLSTHGSVVTRATQADGGNIQITAPHFLRLRDSAITAEVGGGAMTVGGNITVDPQFVVLQNSQISANAFEGKGGNIHIQAQQVFLADPASTVSASSEKGINGQVNIQTPVTNLSGSLVPLPQAFARPATLLSTRCAERLRAGTVSSLVVRGRDGVPPHPGGVVPLLLALAPPEAAVEGQDEASVGQVGGLERPNTGKMYLRGTQAQAPGRETRDMDCARWRGMPGTDIKTIP
jgi:large exoprotein involved in heme utilization and adhesion